VCECVCVSVCECVCVWVHTCVCVRLGGCVWVYIDMNAIQTGLTYCLQLGTVQQQIVHSMRL